jgi:group I intron endonuclease
MGYIYKITNLKNNKCYIGETKELDVERRWKGHIRSITRGGGCPILKSAINKHGIKSFKFEVLIICFDDDRFTYEKEYIKKYNAQAPTGYNVLPGGPGGGFLGKRHTDETKEKISRNVRKFNEENPGYFETYREKLKESMSKVDLSSAVRNSEAFKRVVAEGRVGAPGHTNSNWDETKEKIRKSVIEHYKNGGDSVRLDIEKHRKIMTEKIGRRVGQYTLSGEFIREFPSIAEASRQIGLTEGNITMAVRSKSNISKGYKWKYLDNK